jgi:hypothetical protein
MSAGVIFAAVVKQKSDEDGGTFAVTWIPLTPQPVNEGDKSSDVDSILFADIFSTSSASSTYNCPPDSQMQGAPRGGRLRSRLPACLPAAPGPGAARGMPWQGAARGCRGRWWLS